MQSIEKPVLEITGYRAGSHKLKSSLTKSITKKNSEISKVQIVDKDADVMDNEIDFSGQQGSKEDLYNNLGIIFEYEKENLENNSAQYESREENIALMEMKIQELRKRREELRNKLSQKMDPNNALNNIEANPQNYLIKSEESSNILEINNLEEIISNNKYKLQELEKKYLEQKNRPPEKIQKQIGNETIVSLEQIMNPNFVKTIKFNRPKSSIDKSRRIYKDNENNLKTKLKMNEEKKLETTFNNSEIKTTKKNKTAQIPFERSKTKLHKLRKEEKDLIQLCFDEIPKVNNLALKEEISKYLRLNPKIITLYDLDPNEIETNLDLYSSKKENFLDFDEFVDFLKNNQSLLKKCMKNKNINLSPRRKQNCIFESSANICLLKQKEIKLLYNKFEELDSHNDLCLPIKYYVNKLRTDPETMALLSIPSIYISKYNKFLTLDKFLHILYCESITGSEEEIKNKEFISWNIFLKNLKSFAPRNYLTRLDHPLTEDDALPHLKGKIKDFLIDIFKILKDENFDKDLNEPAMYFQSKKIIEKIRNHNSYHLINETIVRVDESGTGESLKEILDRIILVSDDYVDIDEFLEYFTRRGQPYYFEKNPLTRKKLLKQRLENLEDPNLENNFSFSPNKENSNASKKSNSPFKLPDLQEKPVEGLIDGYDSDPEYHYKRPPRSPPKNRVLSSSFHDEQEKIREQKKSREALNITIPEPFSFNYRETKKKIINDAIEIKTTFKANPVPYIVKENLFEKLKEGQILRRNEVKKMSKIATLQNEKPFSFYKRDLEKKIRKKNDYERKQFIFKANPVPWYCSTKMMGILQEEQEAKRKEKISREAQMSLNKAKLPSRMEKYQHEKKVMELKYGGEVKHQKSKTFRLPSPKEVPNFEILHKTFEIMLENKRRCMKPTIPISPRFHESKKQTKNDLLNQEIEINSNNITKKKRESKIDYNKPPLIQPSSTKKWEQALGKTKLEREKKEVERQKIEREEEERKLKQIKIKERVQNSSAIKDIINDHNKNKNKNDQSVKINLKKNHEKFQQIKQEMEERIRNRPLLVETPLERDIKIEKMKKLISLSKMLKEKGINYKAVFSPEEQEMIADIDFMRKNNYDIESLVSPFKKLREPSKL